MQRRDVLSGATLGAAVAEDEADALSTYFVETQQWKELLGGNVDVIYGPKGSGKSALYILLSTKAPDLAKRNILVVLGENPRGTPVFQDLVEDPPTSENEFRVLWKLYILSLVGERFSRLPKPGPRVQHLVAMLRDAGLLSTPSTLKGMLHAGLQYARQVLRAESVEGGISINPVTGVPSLQGKITFREPSAELKAKGFISVDELLHSADGALSDARGAVWILLDRLDVAFSASDELEANALRALFRVYRDLGNLRSIKLKIFMRSDIWSRIIRDEGFREASHIGRQLTIDWNRNSLLNLLIRRLLRSATIREFYRVDDSALLSIELQSQLFYRVFPKQVDVGSRKVDTLDWILSRTADGTKTNAPRELLQLLQEARSIQLKRWELGESEPEGEILFDRTAIKEALVKVSKTRLEKTLIAENPTIRKYVLAMKGEKTQQNPQSLGFLWRVKPEEAVRIATMLADAGFFEVRGSKASPEFWVPFLYRGGLQLVQGSAA